MTMGDPLELDDFDALPLPIVPTDRLVVGRSNDLKRMDVTNWLGGPSRRTGVAFPQAADFGTWVNQDGATITDLADGFKLDHDNSKTTDSCMARVRTIPGGSWDVRLGCVRGYQRQPVLISGLYLRESGTGKIVTWGPVHTSSNGLVVNSFTNSTTFNATRFIASIDLNGLSENLQRMWLRIVKNGANLEFYATDDPANWGEAHFVQAITTNFTTAPNQWGPFINPNNTTTPLKLPVRMDVIDWSEQ